MILVTRRKLRTLLLIDSKKLSKLLAKFLTFMKIVVDSCRQETFFRFERTNRFSALNILKIFTFRILNLNCYYISFFFGQDSFRKQFIVNFLLIFARGLFIVSKHLVGDQVNDPTLYKRLVPLIETKLQKGSRFFVNNI